MSKEISFCGWISVIPDKMVQEWIDKKYIPNDEILCFEYTEDLSKHGLVMTRLDLPDKGGYVKKIKWVSTEQEFKKYLELGYLDSDRKNYLLHESVYDIIHDQVSEWYDEIFNYVEQWLFENNLLHLEKGSIQTGFCVETDPNHEVVKDWGAPLGKENNKVIQVKEKFGQIRVYFNCLTEEEDKKVKEFEKHVEEKFDCYCLFC